MNEEIKLLNKDKNIKELEKILLEKEHFYENALLDLQKKIKLKAIYMNHEYKVLKITHENEKNNLQKELEIEKEKSSINIEESYRHRLEEISLKKNQEIEILKIEKKLQNIQNEYEEKDLRFLIEKKKVNMKKN